jgi:hypothetical protein
MAVDLKKWKQRNAAERVKAALTKPKQDNTRERLRRRFATAAENALKALGAKERNPWLKYGFNDEVVVAAKLGSQIIAVTGDEAIALKPAEAKSYLRDVIEATNAGQLDRELLTAAGAAPAPKGGELKLKTVAVVGNRPSKETLAVVSREIESRPSAPAIPEPARSTMARVPLQMGLKGER